MRVLGSVVPVQNSIVCCACVGGVHWSVLVAVSHDRTPPTLFHLITTFIFARLPDPASWRFSSHPSHLPTTAAVSTSQSEEHLERHPEHHPPSSSSWPDRQQYRRSRSSLYSAMAGDSQKRDVSPLGASRFERPYSPRSTRSVHTSATTSPATPISSNNTHNGHSFFKSSSARPPRPASLFSNETMETAPTSISSVHDHRKDSVESPVCVVCLIEESTVWIAC